MKGKWARGDRSAKPLPMANEKPPLGYTSAEFQRMRKALLECKDGDRAYFRRWILCWVTDQGHIRPDAEPLPDKGLPER